MGRFSNRASYPTGTVVVPNYVWFNTASTTTDLTTINTNYLITNNYLETYQYKVTSINTFYENKIFKPYEPPQLTPKQLLAAKRKAAIAKAKATRAKNKARALLLMHLDIQQTHDFEKHGFFLVEGSEGNLYQIRTGRSGNVRLLDPVTMLPLLSLCAHPIIAVPDFDTMLAQKLWLEVDEPRFVQVANVSIPFIAQLGLEDPIETEYLALAA